MTPPEDRKIVHWNEWQMFVVQELMEIKQQIATLKVKVGFFSAIISGVVSVAVLILIELLKKGVK